MNAHRPTLRTRVLRHVLPALAVTWLAGTAVASAIAFFFAQHAFDRAMLDDALLLASHVQARGDSVALELSQAEIRAVLYDQEETVYFNVRDAAGRVVSGDPNLAPPDAGAGAGSYFRDAELSGRSLRTVTVRRESPVAFTVVVAETTTERGLLLRQLLAWSLVPQLVLLAALAWWLQRLIASDTAALGDLEKAVGGRDANDLAPLPVPGSTRDVEALAQAINALLERLQRAVQAQREFSSNVAHELRTPLAGIRALADYGLTHDDPALWREQLAAIAQSEVRASSMIDRLLSLSVAAEAETRLALVRMRLDEAVRGAALRFLARADAAGVDFGAHGIDTPAWIDGDPALVEGILNNLIDNALRYGRSQSGGPSTVTVSLEHEGEEIVLRVLDNGAGVPDEQQAHLIERGAQGETGQLLGQGAGLGLALVSQYTRLMGGTIHLGRGPHGNGWLSEVRFAARPAP